MKLFLLRSRMLVVPETEQDHAYLMDTFGLKYLDDRVTAKREAAPQNVSASFVIAITPPTVEIDRA